MRVNCVVPDWIGLDRAHAELAAMTAAQRAEAAPLIPPDDVAAVSEFIVDESLTGRVAILDLLEREGDIEIVGESGSALDAERRIPALLLRRAIYRAT